MASNAESDIELSRRIETLLKELQDSSEHHEQLRQKTLDAHEYRSKVHRDAENVIHSQAPAAKTLERFEIALIVLGTLQWGYGDRLVVLLHKLI
ncbi:MAG: hypothetical protein AB8C46_13305 [Burkholderiaceae bacterium]